jgi:acylphosphatase
MVERIRRRYFAKGQVQGVGFRIFALRAAESLTVHGWVRNLPDGRTVEIVGEADVNTLRAFEGQLRIGPEGAVVQILERVDPDEDEDLSGFEIRP